MQSILSKRYTPYLAKQASEHHEKQGQKKGQDPREANMDLWNNQQGQQIYNEICKEYPNFRKLSEPQQKDIIAQKVIQRMRTGKLITGVDDKRKYESPNNNLPFTPTRGIGGIQNNGISSGFAAPIEDTGHIFTPYEIGKMSSGDFAQNEAKIMQQIKDGLIQNPQPQIDYSNYKNPLSKHKEIFTREDIEKMSTKEYTKYEKVINAQMNDIGIPYKNELPKNATSHTQRKESSQHSNSGDGKWVTINGNHVLIDK